MKFKVMIPLVLVSIMILASFAVISPIPILDNAEAEDTTRSNPLYLHEESYNWTFAKPTFYDDDDPHYSGHTNLTENDWDDIAFVIFFQDKHTEQVFGNDGSYSSKLTSADIYQSVFVNLSGDEVVTGDNQAILLEDFTATWCGYCTAIIGAMDRLDHDDDWWPEKYIGIEYHGSGTYGNTVGSSRKNYYSSTTGIPTWVIDGVDPNVGGNQNPNVTSIDNNIKAKINKRVEPSALNVTAKAGYSSTQAWIDFSVTIEDPEFDNALVDCSVVMIQNAHPRRHGTNSDAYLGWIAQSMKTQRVFNVASNDPVLSDILPAEDSILSGEVEISFNATDPDADDTHILKTVSIREKGTTEWNSIQRTQGKFMWDTATKSGTNYLYPDGEYEIMVKARDYWWDEAEEIIDVTVLNPDPPQISLNEFEMLQEINDEPVMGTLEIQWTMSDDEDDTGLSVDIYYKSNAVSEWTPIVEGLTDVQTYEWDTLNPRVEDEENYKLKLVVTDTDDMTDEYEATSDFRFEINNLDPPTLEVYYPPEEKELSGTGSIKWNADDDEDSPANLRADIFLSSDGGATYFREWADRPNSGTFNFDTTEFDDGDNYKAKVRIRDTDGYSVEKETPIFSIYNNDEPTVEFTSPNEDDTVTGDVELTWDADDEEDPDELTYEIFYMFEGDTYWKSLENAYGPSTGSFTWDTTDQSEGDGVYTLKIVVKDSRDLESDQDTMFLNVYNPDPPIATNVVGPTDSVEKVTTLSWLASDPDPFESDGLKVWIYYRTQDGEWMSVAGAQGIQNTNGYSLDVSDWEDGTYDVKVLVADCQPGEMNKTTEFIYNGIVVDNNDPPNLELTDVPEPQSNQTGQITLSWDGEDPENKGVTFALYYRLAGTDGWIPIDGALRLETTSFIWDVSEMESGEYEIRIVATDKSREKFTTETTTSVFEIYTPVETGDDDDDDDTGGGNQGVDSDGDDSGSSMGLIIAILLIGVILVAVIVVAGLLIMKKKNAEQQIPPPGGLPSGTPPAMPPGQQQSLPVDIRAGGLGPQQNQQQLPPPQQPPNQ